MTDRNDEQNINRRQLLGKLGLATGVVYVAPTMLQLTPAHASTPSRASRPSRPSSSTPSRPSRPSSAGSRISRPSRPSFTTPRAYPSQSNRPSRPARLPGNPKEMPLWLQQLLGLV
jgi:hypothetical protein